VDAAGAERRYHSIKFPLTRADGRVWGVGGISTDITEVIRSQDRELRQAELLRAVFELSPTPAIRMTVSEGQGVRVHDANAAMCRLLGATAGRIADCDLLDHVHPDDAETAVEVLSHALDEAAGSIPTGTGTLRQRELRMRTEVGETVWVLMSAAAVSGGSAGSEIVAQFEDITARRAAEQALSDQAMRDTVTGLPNRRALRERMDAALQRMRRHPGQVAVLFCDLDHFKDVNDSLGHHIGDRLLVEVADRLRSAVRPEDTIARLGGDEFIALGEGLEDPSDAVLMALRLQDKLSAPWLHEGQVFRPAMSIGIAMTDDPDVGVDEMLRRADLAMYRAKEAGRNRVEVYDRSVDDAVQQAVTMQHELRRAIDTDSLEVHYQPIVRLADRELVGMEALVRMRDPEGVLLSPAAFVPQAEATGLIVPLGAWVIQRALADLVSVHRVHGHGTQLAINVSPMQLREDGFADFLLEQMAFAGVSASCLGIEITETALIHDPGRSGRELRRLADAGVRISLDDFGTGYSSLSWLTQFPVNVVKVDKSFTDEVGLDERKTAIVSAVVAVSHELGFTVVAEGVETEEQAARLLDLGCDHGQGYLFGRPLPIGEGPWR
jgi:diguanylate cyclase (GGDEF)-like protein/PAS domain S-box-containing protein